MKYHRILLIRRDNIGDLVCTTPLINALRTSFPDSELWALVNSYNRAVLENHPSLDFILSYTKAKHVESILGKVNAHIQRLRLMLQLRSRKIDLCILAAPGYQKRMLSFVRIIKPHHTIGFVESEKNSSLISMPIHWKYDPKITEVEDVWKLSTAFGITSKPNKLSVYPDSKKRDELRRLTLHKVHSADRIIGIHLSSRKASQRWPISYYAKLIKILAMRHDRHFFIFWAPGDDKNPRHPGDDDKADALIEETHGLPITPIVTKSLDELIAGLSLCDEVICPDGGAMHIAAALGKPIVCLFGNSDSNRWRPWGVPYRLLQTESKKVSDISALAVANAYNSLLSE